MDIISFISDSFFMVLVFFFHAAEHFYDYFELWSDKLLASYSFSSFSGYCFLLFQLMHVTWSSYFGSVFMFVSMYCIDVLQLQVLVGWAYIVCPVKSRYAVSLIICVEYSQNVPCVDYVSPFVVFESWLLLVHSWMRLIFRLAHCEVKLQPQHVSCCAGTNHMKQNMPQQGLVPTFGYAAGVTY